MAAALLEMGGGRPAGTPAPPLAAAMIGADPAAPLRARRIHHLTLTVTDTERGTSWYQSLLGPAIAAPLDAPDWRRTRLGWPSGLVLVLTTHAATAADDRFAHVRVGLDHLALGCASEAKVRAWAEQLDRIGAPRGPVEDVPRAWAVTGRDPDNIPVEFFAPK